MFKFRPALTSKRVDAAAQNKFTVESMNKVVAITTSEVLNRLLQAGIKNVKLGTDIMPCESEARGKRSDV